MQFIYPQSLPLNDSNAEYAACCCIINDNTAMDLFVPSDFDAPEYKLCYKLFEKAYKTFGSITYVHVAHIKDNISTYFDMKESKEYGTSVAPSFLQTLFVEAMARTESPAQISSLLSHLRHRRVFYETISKYVVDNSKEPDEVIAELSKLSSLDSGVKAQSATDYYNEFKQNNDDNRVMVGIKEIDDKHWFTKGNITVVGGDTGCLKTTYTLWLAIQFLANNPTSKAIYFEKEMPVRDIVRKLVSHYSNTSITDVINNKNDACAIYDESPDRTFDIMNRLILVDNNDFHTAEDISRYVELVKPDLFVIDFVTQLGTEANDASSFNYGVMATANKIKRLVQRTGTCGILITQLKKGTIEQRSNKVPYLDDMEWSGTIKQLAAVVLFTFFPKTYYGKAVPETYFYVMPKKSRFNELSPLALHATPSYSSFNIENTKDMSVWLEQYFVKLSKLS